MKRLNFLATGLIAVVMLLGSCTTPTNVAYFPDLTTGTIVNAEQLLNIRVKPDDKLSIIVTTPDPALTAMFNLVSSQKRISGTTSSTVEAETTSGSNQSLDYTVNSKGDIDFPVLGKIHIAGLTREQVAEKIANDLVKADLVKDPIVTVDFANTGISVIGEVKRPGRFEFNRDHLTVIDAIAMAGDLTLNGMRENILVMRKISEGKYESYRVNLLDAQALASSPVFYLQQDDMIYVEPNDKQKRNTTPTGNSPFTPAFWVSLGSFAITVTTFIITLAR